MLILRRRRTEQGRFAVIGGGGFVSDGLVDGGFGHHGREEGLEAFFFALGAREEVAAAAELAFA